MASNTVQLFLRAAPLRSPGRRFIFTRCTIPSLFLVNRRFCAAKSSLEPPDVKQLAETARISLTSQEVKEFAPKIRHVVDWFGQLKSVDLHSVEPALRADTDGDNLRNDVPEIFNNRDALVAAVPTYEDSYIKVPKVLNKQ